MATVTLGNIKLNWKGAYNAGTAYAIDDVVSYNGSSYVAKTATTGNLPTVTANWDLMSQAGTNGTDGTDLTSTLTTQGDIVYRDGSGLARLAAGTNGQVLTTGGSGANPSWGTLSNDYVKLATADTSGVASVQFDNYFSSDYHHYKFVGSVLTTNNNDRIDYNPRISGSNQLANRYETAIYAYKQHTGGTGTNLSLDATMNDTNGGRLGWGKTDTPIVFEVLLCDAQSSSVYKMCQYICSSFDNNYLYVRHGGNVWRTNTNAFTGFQFNQVDGRNCTWKITMYGIKK